jgi:hypothetical protein
MANAKAKGARIGRPPLTKDEIPQMKQAMEKACDALEYLADGKIDEAMSKFSH